MKLVCVCTRAERYIKNVDLYIVNIFTIFDIYLDIFAFAKKKKKKKERFSIAPIKKIYMFLIEQLLLQNKSKCLVQI